MTQFRGWPGYLVLLQMGMGCVVLVTSALHARLLESEVKSTAAEIVFALPESPKHPQIKTKDGRTCPVQHADLRFVRIPYWNTEGDLKMGVVYVHKALAERVRDVFVEVAMSSSPERRIHRIDLIDVFDRDDDLSMAANNTSAFNCRSTPGRTRLSKHAYGAAIDVNPLWNPYVTKSKVLPPEGRAFVERDAKDPRMLHREHLIVKTFKKYGFKWGGDWRSMKDYQHFEYDL